MERINYGAEYKANTDNNSHGYGRHDADIPCAVCHVSDHTAVYMVPTKYTCQRVYSFQRPGMKYSINCHVP